MLHNAANDNSTNNQTTKTITQKSKWCKQNLLKLLFERKHHSISKEYLYMKSELSNTENRKTNNFTNFNGTGADPENFKSGGCSMSATMVGRRRKF